MSLQTRDLAISALSAALWSVLNLTISLIFWTLTHLPILCDVLASMALLIAIWKVKKLGVGTMVGIIATLITFSVRPGALYFLGFTVASIVFDVLSWSVRYSNVEASKKGFALLFVTLILSMWIAGLVIGFLFMGFGNTLQALIFSLLHASGGMLGSVVGIMTISAISKRGV